MRIASAIIVDRRSLFDVDLVKVIEAFDGIGFFFRRRQRGQKQRREDGDDCDDNQQFNQRKAAPFSASWIAASTLLTAAIPFLSGGTSAMVCAARLMSPLFI